MTPDGGTLNLAVIGCGRWGPNHIRVFSQQERARVLACADPGQRQRNRVRRLFPWVRTVADHRELLDDREIDALVICSPTATHAAITAEALDAGKHVLVEKPLCLTGAEAEALHRQAEATGLTLMVGHVFLYNNGILKLHELVRQGRLGRIHYLDAVRTNLGPIRGDVNALYDLAAHDISIFNFLLGETPTGVSAVGSRIAQETIEDVCFATLRYASGALGHIHVSWLNPRKVRTVTAVGEQSMAHWDDVNPLESLRVYDSSLTEPPHYDSFGGFHYVLHSADEYIPKIDRVEPLVNQAQAFLDTVLEGAPCRSGAETGRDVVAVLEAAMQSIENEGRMCPVILPEPAVHSMPFGE